ncbi:hypothetical protein ONV78_23470 [Hahella sp. CR1]|uniref:hypothetical protein n=1 Tax=Hahella sp. CR1 TaxID=2992807 RepID=UPI0024433BB7|nr:hypothetical protein [Hahella sp. CR1]MDG9670717.1 hypothetical protein [Hahella sp. CR1]
MSELDERRRFFRISDTVGLAYRVLQRGEAAEKESSESHVSSASLLTLENDISKALESMRAANAGLAHMLELFNRKINLALTLENRSDGVWSEPRRAKRVNLSACGIAFPVEDHLDVGVTLQLHMILYPSNISMSLRALVIACDKPRADDEDKDGFVLRADFTDIEEQNQEILIQHVLKCQTRQLRERREEKEKKG